MRCQVLLGRDLWSHLISMWFIPTVTSEGLLNTKIYYKQDLTTTTINCLNLQAIGALCSTNKTFISLLQQALP